MDEPNQHLTKQNQQPSDQDTEPSGAIELSRAERIQLFEETWQVIPVDERTAENQQLLSQLIRQGQVQDVLDIQDYYLTLVDNSQHYQTSIYAPTLNIHYIDIDNSATHYSWNDASCHHNSQSTTTETTSSTVEATSQPDVFLTCALCLFVMLVGCILLGLPQPVPPPVPTSPPRYSVPVVPIRT